MLNKHVCTSKHSSWRRGAQTQTAHACQAQIRNTGQGPGCLFPAHGAKPGHRAHQGHGVRGGPSAIRWVCGWRTTADPPGALGHAGHCTNLSRVPSLLPKGWMVLKGRPPHLGASCPLSFKVQLLQRDKFLPCAKKPCVTDTSQGISKYGSISTPETRENHL